MMNTKALIIDLRNTPNGGNTDVAEPIMGRLIQKQLNQEKKPMKKLSMY